MQTSKIILHPDHQRDSFSFRAFLHTVIQAKSLLLYIYIYIYYNQEQMINLFIFIQILLLCPALSKISSLRDLFAVFPSV